MAQFISSGELFQTIWQVGLLFFIVRSFFVLGIAITLILAKMTWPNKRPYDQNPDYRISQYETIDVIFNNFFIGKAKPFLLKKVY